MSDTTERANAAVGQPGGLSSRDRDAYCGFISRRAPSASVPDCYPLAQYRPDEIETEEEEL